MIHIYFIVFAVFSDLSPLELELSGKLPEAGSAWESEASISGEVRIMGRLLEEAIYAGDGRRALLLSLELSGVYQNPELNAFWMARIAWISGLSNTAITELALISPDDPWLYHRSHGLSALFSEDTEMAISELTLSIASASTARKAFWSAIDLCNAYLAAGRIQDALHLSRMLRICYPGDALGDVMYGLCLQLSGQYAESSLVLAGVDSTNITAYQMSRTIMEGFEQ